MNLLIKCREISNEPSILFLKQNIPFFYKLVKHLLALESDILQYPIILHVWKYCTHIDSEPSNFTEFPINIGTERGASNIYKPGKVLDAYIQDGISKKVIQQNQDAFVFYISVLKDLHGKKFTESLYMDAPVVEYNK